MRLSQAAGLAAAVATAIGLTVAAQAQSVGGTGNYRRCPDEAMARGEELVRPYCGALVAAPDLPSYDEAWGAITAGELAGYAAERDAYGAAVAGYVACIDAEVMSAPDMQMTTLDYAACAHQNAGAALTGVYRAWGRACQAYEDSTGRGASEPCFPAR